MQSAQDIGLAHDHDWIALAVSVGNDLDHQPCSGAIVPQPAETSLRTLTYSRTGMALKRAIDIVGSIVLLTLLAIPLAIVALVIRRDSPGPALFRQTRTGHGGETFQILKFRSMSVMEDGTAFVQAKPGDARITRVGAFIRRTSIDELPQLFNVLRGEMSLVGPRPHPVALDQKFETSIENYNDRYLVKPGITGWAQVSGHRGETRETADMARRIEYDLEYVERWSLLFDISILFRTLGVPFSRIAF